MYEAYIMTACMSVFDFIEQWPTRSALAREVGVNTQTVHKWAQRGSIPAEYHFDVLSAAAKRGFTVDPLALAKMHARAAAGSEA